VGKNESSYTASKNAISCSHYGKQMEVPQEAKNRTAILSSNSISGYISEKMKILIQKNICTHMFSAALLTTANIWK